MNLMEFAIQPTLSFFVTRSEKCWNLLNKKQLKKIRNLQQTRLDSVLFAVLLRDFFGIVMLKAIPSSLTRVAGVFLG